jgi:phosphoglycerate dehydrogenase-like enzyme
MSRTAPPVAASVFSPGIEATVIAPADLARLQRLTRLEGSHTRDSFLASPRLGEIEVLVTGWGSPQLDAYLLARMPALQLVLYAAGSIRHMTTDAFWDRDIPVVSAAEANNEPVAEFVIATTVLALKGQHLSEGYLRSNGAFLPSHAGLGIYDRRIGLVGFGSIARKVARGLRRFGHEILVWDPFLDDDTAAEHGVVRVAELTEVFERSSVVSLHAPWLPGVNEGMIGRRELAAMAPSATLINTARGALVYEEALVEVFRERPDLYAILDVTWPEPPPTGSALYELANVRLTGHIAGSIGLEQQRLGRLVIDELERWLAGEPLEHRVTQEMARLRA